jgi:hypothetical protein
VRITPASRENEGTMSDAFEDMQSIAADAFSRRIAT